MPKTTSLVAILSRYSQFSSHGCSTFSHSHRPIAFKLHWLYLFSIFLRGCVHNLNLLKKNSRTIILLKKTQTHNKSNVSKHPMLRFYEKHKLASKLFLFNKETQVEIFFESVFRKSICSGNQVVIAGVRILTQFHIFIFKLYSDLNFNLWICAVQEKDTE